MKVVGLNGSHRKEGNTMYMVKKALEVCEKRGYDTEQINLIDKKIEYCTVCDACKGAYNCTLKDDVMEVIDKLIMADGLIMASPTYFGGVTGRLRSFFDRTLPARRNGFKLSGIVGCALSVGGSRNGGQEYTIQQIHEWMLIHQMIIVSDRKTAHFGGICMAHKPGSVKDDEVGGKTVINTAENLCDTLERVGDKKIQ